MNFKSIALATTALVVIAAAPAQAGQYMGKVNLGFGYASEDYGYGGESDFDIDYTTLHGSASVNVPYSERVNLQFDIFGAESLDEGGEGSSYFGGFGAGAHINWRDSEVGALGVFGSVGRANIGSSSSSDFYVFAAGLEGEYYCNAWTLSAQLGYLDSDPNGYLVKNAGFVNLGAAFYASKQLKIAAGAGYLDGTNGTSTDEDVHAYNWSLSVEYLFGKSVPVSTYVEYKGRHSEAYSPNNDIDRHEVSAGVRFYFGGGDDLQKADREGAGMQSPDLIRMSQYYY